MSQPRPNEQLGRMAYEFCREINRDRFRNGWDGLTTEDRETFCGMAKVIFDFGFQSGVDSVTTGVARDVATE